MAIYVIGYFLAIGYAEEKRGSEMGFFETLKFLGEWPFFMGRELHRYWLGVGGRV